jgi:hypothetical protein
MSSFNATSNKNSGYIYTVPAENTIYEQVISSDMQLNTSVFQNIFPKVTMETLPATLEKRLFWQGFGTRT